MKRSVIIDIIIKNLLARNNGHYSYDEKEHAELVLNAIEDAGRLPPVVPYLNTKTNQSGYLHQWENE